MKRFRSDIAALLLIFGVVVTYFFRLFYPVEQLIVTPDFGRSDAWHFSFPTKYALAQSLNNNTLPVWRTDIGHGFPLLAEGQTGVFFIPNLILFRLFHPIFAYNLALVFSVITLGIGTYVLARTFMSTRIGALFAAVTCMFSGLSITQLTHITLLQGMSLMPAIAATAVWILRSPTPGRIGIYALLLSQQLFAGFPQSTFLTLILVGILVIHHVITTRSIKTLTFISIATIVGISASMAQLLPSYEFLKASTNPAGFTPRVASSFSMPLSHLQTFLLPFALGNPKNGTYPSFTQFDGSIFWENITYIGLLPLLLIGLHLLLHKKNPVFSLFLFIAIGSILFAWGKHSPFYVVFAMWPFTLFRVPSRFLWITILSLAIASSSMLSTRTFSRYRVFIGLILIIHTLQLLMTWWSYHLLIPAQKLLATKQQAPPSSDRILTIGDGAKHNEYFLKNGWNDGTPYELLYTRLPLPNSNIITGIAHHDVYAGRFLQRTSLYDTLLKSQWTSSATHATFSATTFLSLSGIRDIYSFVPVDSTTLIDTTTITPNDPIPVFSYRNPDALPRAYLASDIVVTDTFASASALLLGSSFSPGQSVVLESHEVQNNPAVKQLSLNPHSKPQHTNARVTVYEQSMTDITVQVTDNPSAAILVLSDTIYPGWNATRNQMPTEILTANIMYRGVYVPEGDHVIRFTYTPTSLIMGIRLSGIMYILISLLIILPGVFAPFYTSLTTYLPLFRPRHTNVS